jgi:hypothetical protein
MKKHRTEGKDAAEVRRYMMKRREEHLRQERLEQESKAQSCAKKKQKLYEIMQKQQELVAANVAISRERAAKLKVSDVSSVLFVNIIIQCFQ